jgi:signal transduction histidine kinase
MEILKMSAERISATVTWLVVTSFSLWIMWTSQKFSLFHITFALVLCIIYFAIYIRVTSEHEPQKPFFQRSTLAITLYFLIIGIYFVIPVFFIAIFMVIFSAVTRYFMTFRQAILISPILALPLFFVFTFYWGQSTVIVNTLLFWTFNIFALVMVDTGLREREARLQAELTTRELKATQSLLNEAVKQGERMRIARNIHDLLGHHLTALTINLQVASRKSEGDVKNSIEQCHQLARLLLSDVREAVSDIRDKGKLDLETSIRSMLEKLPKLSMNLHIDQNIQIDDIQIADAIIKTVQESITNTLKHAHGDSISIKLAYSELTNDSVNQYKQIQLDISNDGKMPNSIYEGNGLRGIRERLAALKGKVDFKVQAGKFYTQLLIPMSQYD